ncbi:hypothetical protein [Hydrotalea flava]|uniref:hypothetical protein n=1 Tax=Hydrotalea flava TaxID=714549 RepID=UPI00082B9F9C|nr:hypothetical protein [Hydrotalea flava]
MPQFPFKGSVMPGWQRKLLYAIIVLNIGFLAFQLAVYVNSRQKSSLFTMLYALLLIAYCILRLRSTKTPRYFITVDANGIAWNYPFFAAPEKINWQNLQTIQIEANKITLQPTLGEVATIDLQPGFDVPIIQSIKTEIEKQAKANHIRIQF